jgi:hypothetical protein
VRAHGANPMLVFQGADPARACAVAVESIAGLLRVVGLPRAPPRACTVTDASPRGVCSLRIRGRSLSPPCMALHRIVAAPAPGRHPAVSLRSPRSVDPSSCPQRPSTVRPSQARRGSRRSRPKPGSPLSSSGGPAPAPVRPLPAPEGAFGASVPSDTILFRPRGLSPPRRLAPHELCRLVASCCRSWGSPRCSRCVRRSGRSLSVERPTFPRRASYPSKYATRRQPHHVTVAVAPLMFRSVHGMPRPRPALRSTRGCRWTCSLPTPPWGVHSSMRVGAPEGHRTTSLLRVQTGFDSPGELPGPASRGMQLRDSLLPGRSTPGRAPRHHREADGAVLARSPWPDASRRIRPPVAARRPPAPEGTRLTPTQPGSRHRHGRDRGPGRVPARGRHRPHHAWGPGCEPPLPAIRSPSEEEPHAPSPAATSTHFLLMPEGTCIHHRAGPAMVCLPRPKPRRTERKSDPTRTVVRASSTLPCRIGWSPSPTR